MSEGNAFYRIVFDTNFIWSDQEDKIAELFNPAVKNSVQFLVEHDLKKNVSLLIPEVVLQEREEQILNQIEENVSKVSSGMAVLSNFGVVIDKDSYTKDCREQVSKALKKLIKDLKIKCLLTPVFDQKILVNRALKKTKPFSSGKDNSDKGFKDTLIWLTMLNDVEENKNANYILCTNNSKDFNSSDLLEEFNKISQSKFIIASDFRSLKEILDKELDLKLSLKEENKKIEDEIKQQTGELVSQFNSHTVNEDPTRWPPNAYGAHSSILANGISLYGSALVNRSDEQEIVGYNFKGINFLDISKFSEELYSVQANLIVAPIYKKGNTPYRSIFVSQALWPERQMTREYTINLSYKRKEKIFNLETVSRNLYYMD